MNHFQKLATVLVRVAGLANAVLGVLGLAYGAVQRASGRTLTPDEIERWGASFYWILLGVMLFLLARPLGRLLGRGLD